jgi:uncharacterized protein (DUF2141 family)
MRARGIALGGLLAGAALCAGTLTARAADLRIEIENSDGAEGRVYVSVYDRAEGFGKSENALALAVLPARAPSVAFPALPAGDYAVAAFHDRNGNGKMDSNLVGLPIERYGFSNDAAGAMGPPSFEAARFAVQNDTRIVIHLR